jgi:predicted nucleic acid-binding protein
MRKLKIYLDNCCYNRPYDEQTSFKVVIETLSKLFIQELVLGRKLDLVWSYILKYENSRNSIESKRDAISKWENVSVEFVEKSDEVVALAKEIAATGLHSADSLHVACAIAAKCDYFITTDKRAAKYKDSRIKVCMPNDFISLEVENDE